MIGLVLLYFIGNAFYRLAELHNRSKWGFAILGVVSYYTGTVVGYLIIGVLSELEVIGNIDGISGFALGLLAVPMGLLVCWGLYTILRNKWEKNAKSTSNDMLDSDLMNQ